MVPIVYVDIRVFAHATEDVDKVLAAVRNVLPAGLGEAAVFKRTELSGHYGNSIIVLDARVRDKKDAQAVFEKLAQELNASDRELLSSNVEKHLEKGSLYIRLGKQSAYLGEIRFSLADAIHFRIHFRKQGTMDMVAFCKKLGLLL